ncbi:hypothetical protein K5549_018337, partial [Capra hircus]
SRCSSADTRSSTSIPLVPDKLSSGRQEITARATQELQRPRGSVPPTCPGLGLGQPRPLHLPRPGAGTPGCGP